MRHDPRFRSLATAMALCLLASACDRQTSDADAGTAASAGAPPSIARQEAAPQQDPEQAAEAYYAALVDSYGQDYAACGPSEHTSPEGCDATDTAGTRPGIGSNVLLMLDASGSMAARIDGETKMAAAQDALVDFTRKLSGSANVALRVYGHTGNNEQDGKAESCAGSELLYPFQAVDADRFEAAIRSFEPTGWTPIAAALDAAADDFAGAPPGGANVVYLVSDGIETCDANPVEAARRLRGSDIDVVVNVIGFDVDAAAARQLRAVAEAGGGDYLAAGSHRDLDRIFNERWTKAQQRWSCNWDTQQTAWTSTWDAQQERWTCLWDKSQQEWTDIQDQALDDWNTQLEEASAAYDALEETLRKDESIDPEQRDARLAEAASQRDARLAAAEARRDYARDQADAKRDDLQQSAEEERDRMQAAAGKSRDDAQQAAKRERDRAQDAARNEDESGE